MITRELSIQHFTTCKRNEKQKLQIESKLTKTHEYFTKRIDMVYIVNSARPGGGRFKTVTSKVKIIFER